MNEENNDVIIPENKDEDIEKLSANSDEEISTPSPEERIENTNNELVNEETEGKTKEASGHKNYKRAETGREAYKRTLGNKNYYKDALDKNKNRQESAKQKREELEKKVNEDKERAQSLRAARTNNPNNSDQDLKNKIDSGKKRNLIPKSSRNGDKEKTPEQEAKDNKKELQKAKKEERDAKKEAKDLKADSLRSKAFKYTHPLEAAKMAAGEAVKRLIWNKIKKYVIIAFLVVCLIAILVLCFYAFIEQALSALDGPMTSIANTHEKLDNFLNGMGFQNSEDAFYEELNQLEKDHDYQINIPILMATLFYDDTHNNTSILGIETSDLSDGMGPVEFTYAMIYKWYKESNETLGQDGLIYSSNKIYRLRKLVRNQFDNPLFGSGSNKVEKTVALSEYINDLSNRIGSDLYDALKSLSSFSINSLNPGAQAEDLTNLLLGNEVFTTTDTGSKLEAVGTDLVDILKALLAPFKDVEGVSINWNYGTSESTCNGIICVKYNEYAYSEDTYYEYLRSYYIKNMPEFKKYINASTEEKKAEEIERIINDIKEIAENYEDIFGKTSLETTENYTRCEGNIKDSIIGDLGDPVSLSSSVSLSGSYAYGTSGGSNHQGVDLNETTAGVKEGDSVYSVYNGEVIESTADETYSDKNVKGGWVRIKYVYDTDNYEFDIIYGGLKKDSLTLKKGDTVNKGDTIGVVGSKDESEDGSMPSLHFGFYDHKDNMYMNPTNIFVPCTGSGNSCETFMLHDTNGISLTNFKTAITNYCSSHTCSILERDWDLDETYNIAKSNNINQMYVVANAFREGFSPADDCHNYNYWGIGCYNGNRDCCISYSSFSEGVSALANLDIVQSSTYLYDVFNNGYNSLGSVWLNPGNWSDGGCVYKDYILEYLSESDQAHANSACASGASGVAVTDAEQEAYHLYSCDKTMVFVNDIFGDYIVNTNADTGNGINVSGQTGASGMSKDEKFNYLFPGGMPTTTAEKESYLGTATCNTLNHGSISVSVHKLLIKDVEAACEAAKAEGFDIYSIGGYWEPSGEDWSVGHFCNSSGTMCFNSSQHNFGVAVDINPTDNGQFKNGGATGNWHYFPDDPNYSDVTIKTTGAIYKSFTSNGWGWGGEFTTSKDYMHFSFFGY